MAVTISGSTPTFSVANGYAGGTITAGTVVTAPSTANIDFTSIPSWVQKITIGYAGTSTNGGSILLIRLGTSGGVQTTGYVDTYTYTGPGQAGASTTVGFAIYNDTAGVLRSGIITLSRVNSANGTWAAQGFVGTSQNYIQTTGGYITLSGTLTTVRLTTVNGTDLYNTGSVNILYE